MIKMHNNLGDFGIVSDNATQFLAEIIMQNGEFINVDQFIEQRRYDLQQHFNIGINIQQAQPTNELEIVQTKIPSSS
jgi:hypothetical protein